MRLGRLMTSLATLVLGIGSPAMAQASRVALSSPAPAANTARANCQELVAQAVASAKAGNHAAAEKALTAATTSCPDDASGWREFAGLRFAQSRWRDASTLAQKAVALRPD